MGQMGPVLVSVLFTLNTVTKLNMCQGLRPAPHLDTVASAPALWNNITHLSKLRLLLDIASP